MADPQPDSPTKKTAPYVAFASFKSFLSNLREGGGAPIVIDTSVYGSMGGSLRSQLKGALKFFEMIDDANRPTDRMKNAIAATGDAIQWKGFVGELLRDFYAPILAHPLTSTTPAQLKKEFEATYIGSGDVTTKAITFFIFAAKEADVALSPRLTERQKPQRRASARRKGDTPPSATGESGREEGGVPERERARHNEEDSIKEVTAEAMTRILKGKPPKQVRDAVVTVILWLTMGDDAFKEGGG